MTKKPVFRRQERKLIPSINQIQKKTKKHETYNNEATSVGTSGNNFRAALAATFGKRDVRKNMALEGSQRNFARTADEQSMLRCRKYDNGHF